MENRIKIILNRDLVNKITSTGVDIKNYINVNAVIGESLCENLDNTVFIDQEELSELLEIRKKLNKLSQKLNKKLQGYE